MRARYRVQPTRSAPAGISSGRGTERGVYALRAALPELRIDPGAKSAAAGQQDGGDPTGPAASYGVRGGGIASALPEAVLRRVPAAAGVFHFLREVPVF